MKYQVGDVVQIRPDLDFDTQYNMYNDKGRYYPNKEMIDLAGKKASIIHISSNEDYYDIDLDGGVWCWTDSMFVDQEDTDILEDIITEQDFVTVLNER